MKHTALREALANLLNTPDLNLDELDPITVKVVKSLKYKHFPSEDFAEKNLLKLLDVPDLNVEELDPITTKAIDKAFLALRDYGIAQMKKW